MLAAATLTLLVAGAATAVVSVRSKAQEALSSVTASEDAARVARVQVAKAQDALDRGAQARKAGDTAQADLLDALALEWAATAVDAARAAELERRAAEVEKETAELEARAKRSLTLIEQTVARRGKAIEQLRTLGVDVQSGEPASPPTEPTAREAKP